MDGALKQNIHLKIEVQQRGMELKKLKKLVLELQQALERTQRGTNSLQARDRELEERLEEREREIRELRRQRSVGREDEAVVRELEERNEQLEEDLASVRELLQDNNDEIERLREVIERRGNESLDDHGRTKRERLEELEVENHELATKLKEYADLLARREDEKEDLADEIEALNLQMEDLRERLAADAQERSESRAMFLEEREERQAVEEDLNGLRDKLAAANIELQQRDDDLEVKNSEIDDLIAEHRRIVEEVEDQWRGEVEEARNQVEELRDVSIFHFFSMALLKYFIRPSLNGKPNPRTYVLTLPSSRHKQRSFMPSMMLPLNTWNAKRMTRIQR
jgi:chromosome segregation ATPase